jgi:hypothetical protein
MAEPNADEILIASLRDLTVAQRHMIASLRDRAERAEEELAAIRANMCAHGQDLYPEEPDPEPAPSEGHPCIALGCEAKTKDGGFCWDCDHTITGGYG